MAIISFQIAGHPYKISCSDGQEAHILELAKELDQKATNLNKTIGFVPEGHLLAMVNILTAQELYNLKQKLANQDSAEEKIPTDLIRTIDEITRQINLIADTIQDE